MKKETKTFWALILIGFIMVFCIHSCKVIDLTGDHTVTKVRTIGKKQIVNLQGLQREFVFPTDTLKKGDVVPIKRIK